MKKKLIYILHDIKIGGVEIALISALPSLVDRFDLKIIVLGEIDKKLLTDLKPRLQHVFITFNKPLYLYPFVLPGICRFILNFNPEILVCSLWRASLVGIIIKRIKPGIRFYTFIHNTIFFHALDAFFSKAAIIKADVVLVDSKAAILFVEPLVTSKKPIREISMLTSRPNYGFIEKVLSKDEIRFFFLGRIHAQKNLTLAVEVIKELRSHGLNAVLDIYGRDAGDLTNVQEAIQMNQLQAYIRFCGEVISTVKAAVYAQYHFYIQLSEVEGMAMSVAESMQNGLVCIVTPVGEIPYYSTHMESAIWFNNDQFEESIQAILLVIKDQFQYTKISKNAYEVFQNYELYTESLIKNIDHS